VQVKPTTPILAIGFLFSCAAESDRPAIILDGTEFFDSPWPSDLRTIDGRPDMRGFPGQADLELVSLYMNQIESRTGFGTNSAMFARFDRAISNADLPTPSETLTAEAPFFLMNIDPQSPYRGERVPLDTRFQDTETDWQAQNTLATTPVLGFPLRPRTTYALVFSTRFAAMSESMPEAWIPGTPEHTYFKDLNNTLFAEGMDQETIAHAVRFRTQDPVGEMALFADRIANDLTTPPLDQTVSRGIQSDFFTRFTGEMWLPMWQHGEKPYLTQDGAFAFDEEGRPVLFDWEAVNFTISVPRGSDMPENGWPVVIYAHGTGGYHGGFADGLSALEPANVLGEVGILGIGISLPLHGERSTGIDPSLTSFNYLNPDSAISVFRQASLDHIYLAEVLANRSHGFQLDDGSLAHTDPQRIAYMGHSHGGLIGAIAAPFMGDRVRAMFLSGAGGGLSTTITTRDAGDIDIQAILKATLNFEDDEELVVSHPIIAVVQTLAEITDPINYAPFWYQVEPFWDTSAMPILMTEGLNDLQTPPPTAEALAAAAGLPILEPVAQVSGGHRYRGSPTDSRPALDNLSAWNGTPLTGGLVQFADQDHFAIFQDPDGARLYQQFLLTALNGAPEVVAP
jgi:pimeloyl-ACP methyl ester carboxylesterase